MVVVTLVLPFACAWARYHEAVILRTGAPLSSAQAETAKKLKVLYSNRVRLLPVRHVPPMNWLLRRVGEKLGLVSSQTVGMTLRYGIFIREDHWGDGRLLVHELAHVAQYERIGGMRSFLKQYLQECINPGYPLGELEQEAKRSEGDYG